MTDYGMKDSGARQEFETGARRDLQTGKGRPDLVPTLFIQRLAVVMEKGAEKYGDRNWEKGMPLSRYYASAQRHLMQAFDGDTDEDHLGQCAFNIAAFMWTLNEIVCGRLPHSLDDRPIPEQLPWDEPEGSWELMLGDKNRIHPDTAVQNLEGGSSMFDDDTYSLTPEGLAGLRSLEEANQKLRDAGLVECFDGVWRPASMPAGTRVQTPICEQKGEVIEPRPAVFDPRSPMQPPDREETGDWV